MKIGFVENELPDIDYSKKLVAVIGDHPSQYSRSPNGWNHMMRALGINGVYVPLDVKPENFPQFIREFSTLPMVAGFNVTMPYKKKIVPFLKGVDDDARRIRAVNTVENLVGHNTDGRGEVLSLAERFGPLEAMGRFGRMERFRVLGIGAGGAAEAVYDALLAEVDYLFIVNRTVGNARALAEKLKNNHHKKRVEFGGFDRIEGEANWADIILNTTSVGNAGRHADYSCLAPTDITVLENQLRSQEIAVTLPPGVIFADIVFNPAETVFLKHGRITGHKTLNGLDMLVYQAALGAKDYILRKELEAVSMVDVSKLLREGMMLPDINAWRTMVKC